LLFHPKPYWSIALGAVLLAAGCATAPPETVILMDQVSEFSTAAPGTGLPGGWKIWTLARFKKPTAYDLIKKDGATVVEARADNSASALLHGLNNLDAREHRELMWRWKIEELIKNQDNTRSATEDSPVRLVVRFDGDKSKLDPIERIFSAQVKAVTGQELPYATLMYIWARNSPVEAVITSRFTDRIKMLVAESGPGKAGAWQEMRRDIYEDFKRAYGEEPGPITGIGIMTDTDNTGEKTRAWYGDIRLIKRAP
jgi:Protein of unknown function (DUF3047)